MATAIFAATLLAGVSCEYKDLEIGILRNSFSVSFVKKGGVETSSTYRVVFYPADEETRQNISKGYIAFDMTAEGQQINLPVGNYNVTAWNTDTEHVMVSDVEGSGNIVATTPRSSSMSIANIPAIMDSLYHGQPVLEYPDYMNHANIRNFRVKSGAGQQYLEIAPDSMVVSVHIKVEGIGGLSDATQIKGSLNNVAAKRYVNYDNLTTDSAVVLFDCYVDNGGNVCADIDLFGLEPTDAENLQHSLVLYFYLPEKNKYLAIDVTDQVQAAKEQDDVEITSDKTGVDLREYSRGASSFSLDIEQWQTEEIILGF